MNEELQKVTRGIIEYAPFLLSVILLLVASFCYLSFRRKSLDKVDHFLFSSVAFSLLRTAFTQVLLKPDVARSTGFDRDTAHLIALLLSAICGAILMLLLSIIDALARVAFYLLNLALAWCVLYGNLLMVVISVSMIAVLGCIFVKQKTIADLGTIILGSLEYSFILVYTTSELVSHGSEGMEDALSDALSLAGCTNFLPCIIRVVAAWVLTLLRVALCVSQKTETERLKEQLESERIREQIDKAIAIRTGEEDTELEEGKEEEEEEEVEAEAEEEERDAAGEEESREAFKEETPSAPT